jgi:hypothetical protein
MADPDRTHAYPNVVVGNQSPSAVLFVDSDVLIKFQKVGALDDLLAANRTIIITPEVFNDAVTKALTSSNQDVVVSALAIGSWIDQHATVVASDPNRQLFTGPDAGERSMLADAAFRAANGFDVVAASDDKRFPAALTSIPGSQIPVLTTNYLLDSLLCGAGITPADYFKWTTAGVAAGFSVQMFPDDTSPVFIPGVPYGIEIDGVLRGVFIYSPVSVSAIEIDHKTIFFGPDQKGGVQDLVPIRRSDASDDGSLPGHLNGTEQTQYAALLHCCGFSAEWFLGRATFVC